MFDTCSCCTTCRMPSRAWLFCCASVLLMTRRAGDTCDEAFAQQAAESLTCDLS